MKRHATLLKYALLFFGNTLSVLSTSVTASTVTDTRKKTPYVTPGYLNVSIRKTFSPVESANYHFARPGISMFPTASLQNFSSLTKLESLTTSQNTGEKPQAKVWKYAGKHWAVLPNNTGTFLWRLDGTTWTNILKLASNTNTKADYKIIDNVTHILLYTGQNSKLVSVEYNSSTGKYELWSKRKGTIGINFESGVEVATIDMDSKARMWITNAGTTSVYVRWSDAPYSSWSTPIKLATNITDDDISAIVALPGKIGVFWSNQSTRRFGFKTHNDGDNPASWSGDEVPASQSALNIGLGMADDHMNLMAGSNGILYVAVKTSYNNSSYPAIALLVRRSNGTWDNLYKVATKGTRPIVVLNEATRKIRVLYTSSDNGGSIVYNESSTSTISFGAQQTLISGTSNNNATATHQLMNPDVVVLAVSGSKAVGVLVKDGAMSAPIVSADSVAIVNNVLQAYPNPFKESVNIQFVLAESGAYTIGIYDSNGSLIQIVKQGEALMGELNNTEAKGLQLPAGIYYLKLQTTNNRQTLRVLIQ